MKKRSKTGKIIRMVVCDLLALGVFLVVFSYFHHVRVVPIEPQQIQRQTPLPTDAPVVTPQPVQSGEATTAENTPEPTPEPTGLLMG